MKSPINHYYRISGASEHAKLASSAGVPEDFCLSVYIDVHNWASQRCIVQLYGIVITNYRTLITSYAQLFFYPSDRILPSLQEGLFLSPHRIQLLPNSGLLSSPPLQDVTDLGHAPSLWTLLSA